MNEMQGEILSFQTGIRDSTTASIRNDDSSGSEPDDPGVPLDNLSVSSTDPEPSSSSLQKFNEETTKPPPKPIDPKIQTIHNLFDAGEFSKASEKYLSFFNESKKTDYSLFANHCLCLFQLSKFDELISFSKDTTLVESIQNYNPGSCAIRVFFYFGMAFKEKSQNQPALSFLQKAWTISMMSGNHVHMDQILQQISHLRRSHVQSKLAPKIALGQKLANMIPNLLSNHFSTCTGCDLCSETTQDGLNLTFKTIWKSFTDTVTETEPPFWVSCPISMKLMKRPMIFPSGISYDRSTVLKIISLSNAKDPVTRKDLDENSIYPNLTLRNAIDSWIKEHPWAWESDSDDEEECDEYAYRHTTADRLRADSRSSRASLPAPSISNSRLSFGSATGSQHTDSSSFGSSLGGVGGDIEDASPSIDANPDPESLTDDSNGEPYGTDELAEPEDITIYEN